MMNEGSILLMFSISHLWLYPYSPEVIGGEPFIYCLGLNESDFKKSVAVEGNEN